VSAERRRAERHAAAHRRVSQTCLSVRTRLDNAPFGAPLPCFLRVILSENRKCTFRDHALEANLRARSWEWLGKTRTQKVRRENDRPHPEVRGALCAEPTKSAVADLTCKFEIGTKSDFVGMQAGIDEPSSFKAPPDQVRGRAS
jgi:hypothetical protein